METKCPLFPELDFCCKDSISGGIKRKKEKNAPKLTTQKSPTLTCTNTKLGHTIGTSLRLFALFQITIFQNLGSFLNI